MLHLHYVYFFLFHFMPMDHFGMLQTGPLKQLFIPFLSAETRRSYLCCVCGFAYPFTPLVETLLEAFLVGTPSWVASLTFFLPLLSPPSSALTLLGDTGSSLKKHTAGNTENTYRNGDC